MQKKRTNTHMILTFDMTLIFSVLLPVVKIPVRAKFNQAKCSGSWVIVLTDRKTLSDDAENNTAFASAGSKNEGTSQLTNTKKMW